VTLIGLYWNLQEIQWALLATNFSVLGVRNMMRGVPQGSPTSPFLSIVAESEAFTDSTEPGVSRIAYADDGILYSDHDFVAMPNAKMRDLGVEYADEKSSWVKREGKWLKPLKFLGLL